MTLQDLRYVVALAEHGHFGRAAAACSISQSTLSTQMRKLEAGLGVTLFERTTQSVRVTAVGEDVAARARAVLAGVEAIGEVGRRAAGPLAGPLGLGVIPTLGPYLLPWLVPALRAGYPELRLTVREDLTAPLLERLATHRLDAALVALPVRSPGLETLAVFDEPFRFAEPRRPRAPRGVMRERDLCGQSLLLLTEGHCLRDQALAICGTAGTDAPDDFRATSLETILQMVATGLGSTLVPAMACGAESARAVSIRPLDTGVGRRIGLAWRRGCSRVRDIHLLADVLRRHLPPSVHPL